MTNRVPSSLLPSHSALATEETMCKTVSKRRHHFWTSSTVASAKPRQRVANKRSGWRTTSISKIASASLCILSMLHQAAHAEPISFPTTTKRSLQSGLSIGTVTTVDLEQCYINLNTADINSDGKLSQDEFLSFAQISADGLLDTNEYGMPITEFSQLPQEFVGMYNVFACGSATIGCPSVEGIDIDGVTGGGLSLQQETVLLQLCRDTQHAVEKLTPKPTGNPTEESGPTSNPNPQPSVSTNAPTFRSTPKVPTKTPTTTWFVPTSAPKLSNSPTSTGDNVTTPPAPDAPTIPDGLVFECVADCVDEPSPGETSGWTSLGPCYAGTDNPCAPLYVEDMEYVSGDQVTVAVTPLTPTPTTKPVYQMPSYPPTANVIPSSPTSKPTPAVVVTTPPPSSVAVVTTAPPTSKPVSVVDGATSKPVVGDGDGSGEEPYSGPLSTTFQYEIFNTQNLDALGIMADNDTMAVLMETTTAFMEGVVADTFGQSGRKDVTMKDARSGERRLRYQKSRGLQVFLPPGSVTIDHVDNVECSSQPPNACQRITAGTVLTLVNEPKNTTMLQIRNGISRGLDDPGMTFSSESGIKYAGPPTSSPSVINIPGMTQPEYPPGEDTPEQEQGGTPGWVVPVSIGAAAAGAIILVLLAGSRVQKRKRGAIEFEGYDTSKQPRQSALENDILGGNGGDGSGSFDAEIRLGTQNKVSPLDANMSPLDADDIESGRRNKAGVRTSPGGGNNSSNNDDNPFLSSDSSDSISSVPSGSFSESFSSTSSSDEDIDDIIINKAEAMSQNQPHQAHAAAAAGGGGGGDVLVPGQQANSSSYRLQTLHEVSEDNLSQSAWSVMSERSDTDKNMYYRAGVEALVKEACPEEIERIDDMMLEYEGREEALIGRLSIMLAAKNRDASGSDTEDEDEDRRRSSLSDYTFSTLGDSTYSTLSTHATENPPQENKKTSPTTDARNQNRPELETTASVAVLAAGGSASAAVMAALFNSESSFAQEDLNDNSSSSDAGSSDWSSEDGFSSIGTSSFATADTDRQQPPATLMPDGIATIGDASPVSQRVSGYHGSSKPTFIPVDGPAANEANARMSEFTTDSTNARRSDLDEAIQAGDWNAVGATAALIANPNISSKSEREDFNASALSISSHEKYQVQELEKLVESGDWGAVMAAATRFSTDSESLMESRQSFDDSSTGSEEFAKKLPQVSSPESNKSVSPKSSSKVSSEIIAEIEELVKTVVPDELENLDEMLLQFRGREEELINRLCAMRDDETTEEGSASSHRGDSMLSIFESDREGSTSSSL